MKTQDPSDVVPDAGDTIGFAKDFATLPDTCGAAAIADAVRVTPGPRSKCVLIEKKCGKPLVCNDGVAIAKEFALKDPDENLGAQMLCGAAELSENHRVPRLDLRSAKR